MASDEENRRTIISRANRMLRQSRTLRNLSDELLQESKQRALPRTIRSARTVVNAVAANDSQGFGRSLSVLAAAVDKIMIPA